MDMILGTANILHQFGDELVAIGTDINQIVLERQGQVLINKEVDKGFVLIGQSQILLLGKLKHRALGELVHSALADITLLAVVDAEEEVEHDTYYGYEVYHQCPRHSLGGLTIVHHYVDDGDGHHHVVY